MANVSNDRLSNDAEIFHRLFDQENDRWLKYYTQQFDCVITDQYSQSLVDFEHNTSDDTHILTQYELFCLSDKDRNKGDGD